MVTVNEAKRLIADRIIKTQVVSVPLETAVGSILANDVYSPIDIPLFDNSAMDGYAIRFNEGSEAYRLIALIKAGDALQVQLKPGEASRIYTGAPVPAEADAVVQQEVAVINDDKVSFSLNPVQQGLNIRLKGSQNKKGDIIANANSPITPGLVGLLASAGVKEVDVYSAPSVAIIVTGNELQEIGEELKPGNIYNSNGPALKACLIKMGIKNHTASMVKDDYNAIKARVVNQIDQYDMLIMSGGISVGDYDFVKTIMADIGVETVFYKVKQRPGKPLFAGIKNGKWIFALPGNPASVITCFNQYVKPCLNAMMGNQSSFKPDLILPLINDWTKKVPLTHFLKAKKENGKVKILAGQESFNLLPFNETDCFVQMDADINYLATGTMVEVYNL